MEGTRQRTRHRARRKKLIKRQLKRRFNEIPLVLASKIARLSLNQIESLADAIFDLQSLEDLSRWLDGQMDKINLTPKEDKGNLEIVTSWMERGIEQGIERGIEQGEQKIVQRLVKRRFNEIPAAIESQIESLSLEQIESLADAIFDLQSLEDLSRWLDEQNY